MIFHRLQSLQISTNIFWILQFNRSTSAKLRTSLLFCYPSRTFVHVVSPAHTLCSAMSRRGRGRGRGRGGASALTGAEPAFSVCERAAKIKKSGYEGFKETDDDDPAEEDAEYLESRIAFCVDHPISLIGVKFASEIYHNPKDADSDTEDGDSYEEEAFIYLYEGNVQLAETHIDDEVPYRSMIEARFTAPCRLEKGKVYKLRLLCNVDGAYPLAECSKEEVQNGVSFNFKVGKPEDTHRDGLIRALLFKKLDS